MGTGDDRSGNFNGVGNSFKLPPEAFGRTLFEEAPCYFSILDEDLNIIKANRRCREDFATLFTRHCYQAFKDRNERCSDCPALESFRRGVSTEAEEVLIDRSGREVHVLCRTAPIKDDEGDVTAILHMSALVGSGEKLQRDLTALDSQIGAVSHGIKGLITAMEGGFYLWDSGLDSGDAVRMEKGLGIVRRNLNRLNHLAHDVLYYIRARSFHHEKIDGANLVERVAAEMATDAGWSGASIVVEPPIGATEVRADRRALESAVVNLVVSSLDDCRNDKRDIDHAVHVGVRAEGDEVIFEVSDNGGGIEPEDLEKIFSLFFSPKGIEAGGIGLFIANKIARVLGGRIDIESKTGEGRTAYKLILPTFKE